MADKASRNIQRGKKSSEGGPIRPSEVALELPGKGPGRVAKGPLSGKGFLNSDVTD